MLPALTYLDLQDEVRERYNNKDHRIMGIVLAHYGDELVKRLVDDFYMRWNRVTGYDFDMFWTGYGTYLPYCDEKDGKVILKFNDNVNRVYFDDSAFHDIQERVYANLSESYIGNPQIILIECQNGEMIFDNYYIVNLEFDMRNDTFNYRKTNQLIHEMAGLCRRTHNLEDIFEIFRKDEWKKYVKIVGNVIRIAVQCVQ